MQNKHEKLSLPKQSKLGPETAFIWLQCHIFYLIGVSGFTVPNNPYRIKTYLTFEM